MPQVTTRRDEVVRIYSELYRETRGPSVSLDRVRALTDALGQAVEEMRRTNKIVAEIAAHGRLTRDTRRELLRSASD